MAGLRNKDKDFWARLKDWDVIMMCETWICSEGWERVKERLPKDFSWKVQWTRRESRKGRAMGGDGDRSEKGN